jgi:predicted ribosome quality control (RQC) complex YloA/Tae2 family protein
MDNVVLDVLVRQLQPVLTGRTLQKIKLAEKYWLTLQWGGACVLVVCFDPTHPGLFLETKAPRLSSDQAEWVMGLRRHLGGARLVSLHKVVSERTLFFAFEYFGSGHIPELRTLVMEFVPGRTGLFLFNQNREILTASREDALPTQVDTWLRMEQSLTSPELSEMDIAGFEENIFASLNPEKTTQFPPKGIPPWLVREVQHEIKETGMDPRLCCKDWGKKIIQGPYSPALCLQVSQEKRGGEPHTNTPARKIIVPFKLSSPGIEIIQVFATINDAVRTWMQEAWAVSQDQAVQTCLRRELQTELKKKRKLQENLQKDLARFEKMEEYKKYADLLYAQPERPGPGRESFRLVDLYHPEFALLDIPLDKRLSLIQNANQYSRLFQKANTARPRITQRINKVMDEINGLEQRLKQLATARPSEVMKSNDASNLQDLASLEKKKRIPASGVVRAELPLIKDMQSEVRSAARVFQSSEGMTILVGKSSRDNDQLTQKLAHPEDFWLHVANYGGSHVLLRNPGKLAILPQQSLLEAAQLAAYFSQARNASKVEVHYTQKKHVSKPRGAKPGLVSLRQFKSIRVVPKLI